MRSGFGYDVHRLVKGRDLVLGGVKLDHKMGLLGHSDADVLLHAICDALLGAAGLGDIGVHFPDNDNKYKDISSMKLLIEVKYMLEGKGFKIINIDSTVLAEEPKLSLYFSEMVRNIAHCCGILESCVNVKATTNEGMGFVGHKEGIAAYAVVTIEDRG